VSALLARGHGALLQALPAAPSPSPSIQEIPAADQTSPGLLGFLVTFGVVIAVIGLGYGLVRQLRRVDRNARRLAAEEERRAGGTSPDAGGTSPGAGGAAPDGEEPRA
jgi:hypothetical protein